MLPPASVIVMVTVLGVTGSLKVTMG